MLTPFDEELKIGDRIADRYQVLGIIGKGSMGIVYKGRHLLMGRLVAIKMLRGQFVVDERTVKRFEREAKAASRLDHPNLIQVYDFGLAENGQPYLVMDYVQGRTLYEIQRREEHIIAERAVNIFSQVCDALYHAHLQGVIHRDIKPSNIMLVERPHDQELVKVFDLGVAKIAFQEEQEAEALTNTGEVCGSPVYLSPEQCRNESLDHRSDIYALGVVMYELLSGVPPILGATVYDTIYMHVYQQPLPLSAAAKDLHIPERLERIVMKALEKNPDDRYQSMQELKWELQASLQMSDPDVKVLPPGAVSQLRKRRGSGLPSAMEVEELKPRSTPYDNIGALPQPKVQPPSPSPTRSRLSEANKHVSSKMQAIARTGQSPVFLICATAGITVGVTLTILSVVTGWHPGVALNAMKGAMTSAQNKPPVIAQNVKPIAESSEPIATLPEGHTEQPPQTEQPQKQSESRPQPTKPLNTLVAKKEIKPQVKHQPTLKAVAVESPEQRLASATNRSNDPGQSAWNSFLGIFQQGSSPSHTPKETPPQIAGDQPQLAEPQQFPQPNNQGVIKPVPKGTTQLVAHKGQTNSSPTSGAPVATLDPSAVPAGGMQPRWPSSGQQSAPISQPLPPLTVPPLEAVELNNEGVQLLKSGSPDAAIIKFQSALKQYPTYVKARANLGRAFANLANKSYSDGNIEQAGENYRVAIRTLNGSLGPNHQDTVNVQRMYADFLRATSQNPN